MLRVARSKPYLTHATTATGDVGEFTKFGDSQTGMRWYRCIDWLRRSQTSQFVVRCRPDARRRQEGCVCAEGGQLAVRSEPHSRRSLHVQHQRQVPRRFIRRSVQRPTQHRKRCVSHHRFARWRSVFVPSFVRPDLQLAACSVVRTTVFGWRTLPGLCLIYGWHVTTSWVKCSLWVSQPGQLSPSGLINE